MIQLPPTEHQNATQRKHQKENHPKTPLQFPRKKVHHSVADDSSHVK
jgi:hypothetical protein